MRKNSRWIGLRDGDQTVMSRALQRSRRRHLFLRTVTLPVTTVNTKWFKALPAVSSDPGYNEGMFLCWWSEITLKPYYKSIYRVILWISDSNSVESICFHCYWHQDEAVYPPRKLRCTRPRYIPSNFTLRNRFLLHVFFDCIAWLKFIFIHTG